MTRRTNAPVKSIPDNADLFLYIPDEDIDEALVLGVKRIPGDARFVRPKPLPDGVSAKAYEKWQTEESKYRWCMKYIARILGSTIPISDFDDMLQSLGEGQVAQERVYLYVPAYDLDKVRQIPGVYWDKRRRGYYAGLDANMNDVYVWLTPAAKSIWESEQVMRRALTLMVQDQARNVVKRKNKMGGYTYDNEDGNPKHKKPLSRTQAI